MKVDLYTKSALTVIAVALCALAFQNVKMVPEAQAQSRSEIVSAIRACLNSAAIMKPPSRFSDEYKRALSLNGRKPEQYGHGLGINIQSLIWVHPLHCS